MNLLYKFIFKSIIRKQVRQGPNHPDKIQFLYQMIRDAAEEEFYEDNTPTLNCFLKELFTKTQK